jgi:hypothetical protein
MREDDRAFILVSVIGMGWRGHVVVLGGCRVKNVNGVEGTNKIEVSSGLVSSGALSSAEDGPRGLPLVKRPIM